jgi:hypothetical protein
VSFERKHFCALPSQTHESIIAFNLLGALNYSAWLVQASRLSAICASAIPCSAALG